MHPRLLSAALAASILVSPLVSHATTSVLTVDTAAQRDSAGDLPTSCTLGDALVAANLDQAEGGCVHPNLGTGGPFEIVLPPGMAFVLSSPGAVGTDGAPVGLPVVVRRVHVRGHGNLIERDAALACPGAGAFRILDVALRGDLTLEGVVLRNGCAPSGGGMRNAGRLMLRRGGIEYSMAHAGNGGGLANAGGAATLIESHVADNSATGSGGGIHHVGDAPLVLDRSSVVRNTADTGGGIENLVGQTTLINTTVSGNSAARGGAIENSGGGRLSLINTTVAVNRATVEADGILNRAGGISFANSVLVNRCVFLNPPGLTDAGHNLERRDTCGLSAPTSIRNAIPLLYPLAHYGGWTESQPLEPGSPAIDAGNAAMCSGPGVMGVDQRGVPRPDGDVTSGGHCDIGAAERADCDADGTDDGVQIAANPDVDADGSGVPDSCENEPPVAYAGLDQVLECTSPAGVLAMLDGSGSWDPDGDSLSFDWSGAFGSATGMTPSVQLGLGSHAISLSVSDPAGLTAADAVDVVVSDTAAPSAQAWFESTQDSNSQARRVVRVSCSDTCDGTTTASASFDGQPVVDGDVVTLPVGRASDLVLSVTCQDAAGNVATAQAATPSPPPDPPAPPPSDPFEKLRDLARKLLQRLVNFVEHCFRFWRR
jgi:hypothetical protein